MAPSVPFRPAPFPTELAAPAGGGSGVDGGGAVGVFVERFDPATGTTGGGGTRSRWWRPRTSGAVIAAQLGGDHVQVTSIITNPNTDPHDYEPTAGRRPHSRRGPARDRERGRLRPVGAEARRGQPDERASRLLDVGDLVGAQGRRQPAPLVLPGRRRNGSIDQITADYQSARPGRRRLLRPASSSSSRPRAWPRTTSSSPTSRPSTRARRSARRRASSWAWPRPPGSTCHPASVPRRHQRGHRPHRGRQGDGRRARSPTKQIKVFVFNSQNSTPDVQALVDAGQSATTSRSRPSPRRSARPARRSRTGSRPSSRALETRWPRPPEVSRHDDASGVRPERLTDRDRPERGRAPAVGVRRCARSVWAATGLERRRPARCAAGEFVAVLGPNGVGKSTLVKAILGLLPLAAGDADRCSVERPGGRNQRHRLPAPAAQLRPGPAGPRRRRRPPRPRRRPVGAPAAAPPAAGARRRGPTTRRVDEVIELVGATAYADRPDRRRSPAASSSACSSPRPWCAGRALLLLDEPLDSLDLPNQASVAALIADICARQGVTVMLVAHDVNPILPTSTGSSTSPTAARSPAPPDEVITGETLTGSTTPRSRCCAPRDGRLVVVGQPEAPAHHDDRHPCRADDHPALAFGQPSLTWNLGSRRPPALRVPLHGQRLPWPARSSPSSPALDRLVHGAAPPDLRRPHPGRRRLPRRGRRRAARGQRRRTATSPSASPPRWSSPRYPPAPATAATARSRR